MTWTVRGDAWLDEARSVGKLLDGYPTWSQRRDPGPSGAEDPYSLTDCGEECCSIVLMGLTGRYTTEGEVREAMPGHSQHGETTAQDIASYLAVAGLSASSIVISRWRIKERIRSALDEFCPLISLGYYVSPSALHWVVVVGYGDDHCLVIDPWYGELLAWHWARMSAASVGVLVSVARTP